MSDAKLNPEIVADVKKVAARLGTSALSRGQYLQHATFSEYDLYDGGTIWDQYCKAAGVMCKAVAAVGDEAYLVRLKQAVTTLGRLPKNTERKRFGLNFTKRRFPTLDDFFRFAASAGVIDLPSHLQPPRGDRVATRSAAHLRPENDPANGAARRVPPIPTDTRRRKWLRTGVDGLPYAPQDELGTVALFGVLCARGVIRWQILDLNGGKGIDARCWDDDAQTEIRVEVKYVLSRTTWNHSAQDIDFVVCWENRWADFPKQVIELRKLVQEMQEQEGRAT